MVACSILVFVDALCDSSELFNQVLTETVVHAFRHVKIDHQNDQEESARVLDATVGEVLLM